MAAGTVVVEDVCGNTHVLRERTIEEAHGQVGSYWPVVWQGVRGHFRFAFPHSNETVFVAQR